MNIRMPRHMDEEILKVQDEFLKEDAREKGIVTLDQIPTVKEAYTVLCLLRKNLYLQGDITRLQVGAIVNAANSQMLGCFVPATDVLTTRSIRLREWSFVQSAAAR